MKVAYRIEYDSAAEDHLAALSASDQATVLDSVIKQRKHQPNVATRNRKPMRVNPLAPWELRIGSLRVYYALQVEPGRVERFAPAVAVARRHSARSFELRAAASLARLLRSEERNDEARRALQEVYEWFSEGLDTADLMEARALLAEF